MLTGSFAGPVDVAQDEKTGDFYVLDVGNDRIQKFDKFSNFKESCGRSGIHDGEFDRPTAIALGPRGDTTTALYVVDSGNHRIQICDPAKMFKTNDPAKMFKTKTSACDCASWGSRGSGTPRGSGRAVFESPRDIAFLHAKIFVLDSGNERVLIFSSVSDNFTEFLQKWDSSTGTTGGTFTDLRSIATSEERIGYIYLLGSGCVVQQFKLDGTLVHSWSAIAPESGLCVPARLEVDDKYHFVYVLDAGNSLLMCYNPDGLYRWALRGAQAPFSKPLGFAVNRAGDEFLVVDTGSNIVQKFTLR